MSEVTFRPIPLGQDLELGLSAASPTYEIGGKRRHFVALKIPDGFEATAIEIKSYLTTAFLPRASAVVPELVFLDGNHRVLDTRPAEDFEVLRDFGRSGVTGRVNVPVTARYFMVMAGDGSRGVPVIHRGGGSSYRVNPAALGDFSVRVFGEQRK